MGALQPLDYVIIVAYFCVTAGIGIWVARHQGGDSEDQFLAGRSLGPLAVGFSLYAANVSSDTLVGLPGGAYRGSIAVANYEWMAGLALVAAAFTVVPVLLRSRITTVPELLERRYSVHLRKYLSGVTLFLSLVIDTSASLYAGSVVITTFFPAVTLWQMSALLAAFTAIYTASGGLRAVVYTDVMQAVVLLGGSIVLAILVFGQLDFSWSRVTQALEPGKLSMIQPLSDKTLPWLGLIIGLPVAEFYYWTMNQYVIQRALGARDVNTAARASIIAASLKLLNPLFMVVPGAMMVILLPNLQNSDSVYPQMIKHFAPVGLTGLLLAGLAAALMSSLSAVLNSSSTLVTLDFVRPRKPDLTDRQLVWISRIAVFVIAALAAAWAPMIQHFSGLFNYIQLLFAYIASPLVAVFLLGLFFKRLGPKAALRALVCGHTLSALLFAGQLTEVVPLHFTIEAGIICAATALFALAWMAYLGDGDRPSAESAQFVETAKEGVERFPTPIKLATLIVVALTAVLVGFFW